MYLDADTFLVALYTIIDDLYQAHLAPHRPPRRPWQYQPELSDSEVLTLKVLAQWLGCSERRLRRYAQAHWQGYFPRLLSQSAFNRRSRDLVGPLLYLTPLVAQQLEACRTVYEAVDTVPVPLLRRCRGERHRLFGDEAAIGRGGADRDWYYGCKLLLAVTAEGVITGFLLAPASTEDRWVGEAFWCWRQSPAQEPIPPEALPPSHRRRGQRVGPTGPRWPRAGVGVPVADAYLTDTGFSGAWWQAHWQQAYQATVLTGRSSPTGALSPWHRVHAGWRQVVETVNGLLTEVFHLTFPKAKTRWGLLTTLAAKLVAFNVGIYLNRRFHRDDLALPTLFPW